MYRFISRTFLLVFSLVPYAWTLPLEPSQTNHRKILVVVVGSAKVPDHTLDLAITLNNQGTATFTLDPGAVQLTTPQGWRNHPLPSEYDSNIEIRAGEQHRFSLRFQPVNSMALYQLLRVHGDFEPSYRLQLADGMDVTIAFQAEAYGKYLANDARESQLQVLLPGFDREIFLAQQNAHYAQHLHAIYPETASVVSSHEQQVISGVALQWRLVNDGADALLHYHLVNHNREDLRWRGKAITLRQGERVFTAEGATTEEIKAGARVFGQLRFRTVDLSHATLLDASGISVHDTPLYAAPMPLVAVPKDQW